MATSRADLQRKIATLAAKTPALVRNHPGDVTSAALSTPLKSRVTVASFQARKGQRRSDEEVAIYRRTGHLLLAASRVRHPVADVCRQTGISEATFYAWKKKYASVAELRQLRQLQEENSRLKRWVADLTLDKQILTEVIRKKI
jgi:putative transposase